MEDSNEYGYIWLVFFKQLHYLSTSQTYFGDMQQSLVTTTNIILVIEAALNKKCDVPFQLHVNAI